MFWLWNLGRKTLDGCYLKYFWWSRITFLMNICTCSVNTSSNTSSGLNIHSFPFPGLLLQMKAKNQPVFSLSPSLSHPGQCLSRSSRPRSAMVCAGPRSRQHLDQDFHLGYFGKFSLQSPKMHPQHSRPFSHWKFFNDLLSWIIIFLKPTWPPRTSVHFHRQIAWPPRRWHPSVPQDHFCFRWGRSQCSGLSDSLRQSAMN